MHKVPYLPTLCQIFVSPLAPFSTGFLSSKLLIMTYFFTLLMLIAMLATLGALGLGLVSMVKGGDFDKKYSTRLMQARIIMQALALGCLALAWMSSTHNG